MIRNIRERRIMFMKKIISLIMIVVLCIDNSVFAFAQDKITAEEKSTEVDCQDIYEDGGFESDVEPYADYFNGLEKQPKVYVTSENRECEVCADLNEFTKWGIVNGVNKVLVDCSKREIVYKLEFENFTDEITVKRNDSEILDMVVRQGEIQNNIQVKKNKCVIVDGHKYNMNNSPEMLNGVRVLNQTVSKCPYGNASDYSYKMGTGAKASIKLDKAISQITSVAFEFIVVAELGIPGLIVDAYDLAYAGLSAYSPQTKGISCKWTNYSHKKYKDTYIKPIDMYVYKIMYKWYSELNYKGVEIPETCYQTKQFLQ